MSNYGMTDDQQSEAIRLLARVALAWNGTLEWIDESLTGDRTNSGEPGEILDTMRREFRDGVHSVFVQDNAILTDIHAFLRAFPDALSELGE